MFLSLLKDTSKRRVILFFTPAWRSAGGVGGFVLMCVIYIAFSIINIDGGCYVAACVVILPHLPRDGPQVPLHGTSYKQPSPGHSDRKLP
jgi:hypothetical protein